MFAVYIMNKQTRYDKVAQGPHMNFSKYTKLTVELCTHAKYICGPCATVDSCLVIARFSHYIQREHSITPPYRNQV